MFVAFDTILINPWSLEMRQCDFSLIMFYHSQDTVMMEVTSFCTQTQNWIPLKSSINHQKSIQYFDHVKI